MTAVGGMAGGFCLGAMVGALSAHSFAQRRGMSLGNSGSELLIGKGAVAGGAVGTIVGTLVALWHPALLYGCLGYFTWPFFMACVGGVMFNVLGSWIGRIHAELEYRSGKRVSLEEARAIPKPAAAKQAWKYYESLPHEQS